MQVAFRDGTARITVTFEMPDLTGQLEITLYRTIGIRDSMRIS